MAVWWIVGGAGGSGGAGADTADGDAGPTIIVSTAPDDATAGPIVTADGAGGGRTTTGAGAVLLAMMARRGLTGGGGRRSGRAGEQPSSATLPDVPAVTDRRTILGSGGGGMRGGGMGGGVLLTLTYATAALTLQPLAATDGPFGVQVFRAACPCQFMRNKFNRTTKVFPFRNTNPQINWFLASFFFWVVSIETADFAVGLGNFSDFFGAKMRVLTILTGVFLA